MNKLILGCALSVLAASPALANEAPLSRTISYADLDLTRAEGRATLDRRIGRAARIVCGARSSSMPLIRVAQARRCIRSTLGDARRRVELAVARARQVSGEMQLAAR